VGDSGTVKNSYSIGNITSTSHSYLSHSIAGGIAGRGGIIDDSYSIGKITATSTTSAIVGPESYSHAGGIAGNGSGSTIKNSYSIGDISAVSTSPEAMITAALAGGIVGYGFGTTSTIENCYSIGDINSSSYNYMSYAGGIAGDGSTIKNSYSIGNITANSIDGDAAAGGIAADGNTIENSYSIGDITAIGGTYSDAAAGGIVGTPGYSGTIDNCAALNENIISSGAIGRIAGNASSGTFTNNFANSGMLLNDSPVTGTANDKEGDGKTLSLFEDQVLYETDLGWEFGNGGDALIWKMPTDSEYKYPILYWQ
jgi:hypothetical protein